jgi:hypothetical protein
MGRLYVTVALSKDGEPGYTYFTHLADHKVGDWVIVELPRDERGRLVEQSGIPAIGRVTDAKPPGTMRDRATKWIIDRIEWDAYRARSALAPVERPEAQ